MSVASALGRTANGRGSYSERLALDAATLAVERIDWMLSARAADNAEDRRGIDIVVESDVGALYLQVKSSRKAARDFNAEDRRAAWIEAVPVARDSATTFRRIVGALTRLRARVLDRRGGA